MANKKQRQKALQEALERDDFRALDKGKQRKARKERREAKRQWN